jgi:aminopeptidase-like protein
MFTQDKLIEKIFYLNRSLLGVNNDESLNLISKKIPLRIHSFASNTNVLDWKVPKEWILKKAILSTADGKVICDAGKNILNVVNYSRPVKKIVSYSELKKHLHYSEYDQNSIPYRTTYYSDQWGFCLTKKQFLNLDKNCNYSVEIESSFVDSTLKIGESIIKGKSDKEIIFTSYLCHPLQAHDGLSGVAVNLNLYDKLVKKDNYYTYRFFFLPETIGPLCLLHDKTIDPQNTEFVFVNTCVGFGDNIFYKKSFIGDHPMDNIICDIEGVQSVNFFPNGSDERQFSSPKIRIPASSIMTNPYGKYKDYHTSKDDLSSIDPKIIEKISSLYEHVLEKYETRKCYIIKHAGGEPFLSKYDLYREIGATRDLEFDKIRNWVIFYSDGMHSVLDIHKKTNIPIGEIQKVYNLLLKNNIVEVKK